MAWWRDGGRGGPCNLDLEDAAVSSPGGPVFLLMTPSCRFSRMHGCRWSFLQELQTRRHVRFHKRNRAARFPTWHIHTDTQEKFFKRLDQCESRSHKTSRDVVITESRDEYWSPDLRRWFCNVQAWGFIHYHKHQIGWEADCWVRRCTKCWCNSVI